MSTPPIVSPRMAMVAVCGLEQPMRVGGDIAADMTVRTDLLDDGYATAGILAILFDWVLGMAVVADAPGMILTTTYLHIEMLCPAIRNPTTLHGLGRAQHLRQNVAVADGTVAAADGIDCARATMGALLLDQQTKIAPRGNGITSDPRPAPYEVAAAGASGTVVETSGSGVVLRFHPGPDLANLSGGVHGGVGVLMAHRTLDTAVKAAGQSDHRLLELRAAFTRPIAATGEPIDCAAQVLHRGRRLTLVRGELRDHAGRAAVRVDATYMIGLTDGDDPRII